ncbi:MAG: hypothetical protein U0992_06415 [Planctomycetaceae bacterium]
MWTAAFVLAFVMYLAGAPIVIFTVVPKFPSATPVLMILYLPLDYYCDPSADRPGADLYRDYAEWCRDKLIPRPPVIFTAPPQTVPNR